jgi:hypothetical protein
MKPPSKIPLGPFSGLNTVQDETSPVFQPSAERPMALREAVNVDLDDAGWLRQGSGTTKLATLTDAHSLQAVQGRLFLVDDGTLYRVHPGRTDAQLDALVSGLVNNRRLVMAEAGQDILACNGTDRLWIHRTGDVLPWGLEIPSVTATPTTGNLSAGQYLVSLTVTDRFGRESGAPALQRVDLPNGGGITLSLTNIDPTAITCSVYLSVQNGELVYHKADIALPMGTINVRTPVESKYALKTLLLDPCPVGASQVAVFRGYALVAVGNTLYWSQPLGYHLFDLTRDLQLFADEIVRITPSDGGFYLFEGERTWWIGGDQPENWSPTLVDSTPFSAGPSLKLPANKIPKLQSPSPGLVSVWRTADGPVVGLPGGILVRLADEAIAFDHLADAALAYREEAGIAQLLMAARSTVQSSTFAASDRPICLVRKALSNT